MFRYIPLSDFLVLDAGSVSADATAADFDALDARVLPTSRFWRSGEEASAYLEFSLEDSAAVPGVFAAINTRALPGQALEVLEGGAVLQRVTDPLPWNRVQAIAVAGMVGSTFRLRFSGASAADWQCGFIVVAPRWREVEEIESLSWSNHVPQLKEDSETTDPILSEPAGKQRKFTLNWSGNMAEQSFLDVLQMFDELDDRKQVALVQPSTRRPYVFFGRMESCNGGGPPGAGPERLSCEFVTDGLGQVP